VRLLARERCRSADVTETYWHLLDEDEWAELVRSEQLPAFNRYAVGLEDAVGAPRRNGSAHRAIVPKATIACTTSPPIPDDLADLIACLGIPIEVINLDYGRQRMALDRLNSILHERTVRELG
jgi:hypothetical protein